MNNNNNNNNNNQIHNNNIQNKTAICSKCNKTWILNMGCGTCREKDQEYAKALAQLDGGRGGGSSEDKVQKWIDSQSNRRRR